MRYFSSSSAMTCAPQIRNARWCSVWETDLVQFLVELVKLCGLRHLLLVHEEWRLDFPVALAAQEVEAVRDERLVEIDTIAGEVVSSVTGDLHTYALSATEIAPHTTTHLSQGPSHRDAAALRDARGYRAEQGARPSRQRGTKCGR